MSHYNHQGYQKAPKWFLKVYLLPPVVILGVEGWTFEGIQRFGIIHNRPQKIKIKGNVGMMGNIKKPMAF